jgi:hypothetical protein
MNVYKIKPEAAKKLSAQSIKKSLPIFLVALTASIFMVKMNPSMQAAPPFAFILSGFICLGAFSFGAFRSMKQQKKILDSYRLIIDEDSLTRQQFNTPVITIKKADIREIVKTTNGNFSVRTDSKLNAIAIPAQINDYEEVERLLNEIQAVRQKNTGNTRMTYYGISLLSMALFVGLYIADNKIIVAVCGISSSLLMAWSFITTLKSKNVDNRSKRFTGMTFALFFIIVGMTTIKLLK